MQRLQELLEVKPSNQDFPLVIIVAASANQDVSYNNLSQHLNLDLFIEQGFICDVKVLVLDYDYSLYEGVDVVEPQVSEKVRNNGGSIMFHAFHARRLIHLKNCS